MSNTKVKTVYKLQEPCSQVSVYRSAGGRDECWDRAQDTFRSKCLMSKRNLSGVTDVTKVGAVTDGVTLSPQKVKPFSHRPQKPQKYLFLGCHPWMASPWAARPSHP